MDVLDRFMKSLSNMTQNITNKSPTDHVLNMINTKCSDFLVLSENLYGRSAASMMNSDKINKVIYETDRHC